MAVLPQAHFDLAVADADAAKADGYTPAGRVKQTGNRIRVVLVTSRGPPLVAEYTVCREIDGWLFKPFNL